MKVFLITPLSSYSQARWIPLGPCYISANLKSKNHDVKLYDRFLKFHILKDNEAVNQDMKLEILEFKPDIIGLATISPAIYDTLECVEYIRGFYKGIILAGGHHATAMPSLTLEKIPGIDFIAAGEAENTMLSLAEGKLPSEISGLYSRNTDIRSFMPLQIKNLDELPLPDYKIFDMSHYTQVNRFTIRGFYLKTASVISSRGCPNNCKYCSESLTYGKGVRFHSADYVIENIEKLIADYKVQGIYFHDNNFLSSHWHAEDICRKIIKRKLHKKIKWAIQSGVSTINNDILKILSESGCVKIELGMESLKDSNLESMDKNTSKYLNERALNLCRLHNIKVHAYFMTGFDEENISDLEDLLFWVKKFKPHTFSLHPIKIYPGTQLYDDFGDSFFEKNSWNKHNIEQYFNTERFSSIDKEKTKKWFIERYKPFQSKHQKKALLQVNSPAAIFKMALSKYFKC